ncbi:MAG: hypothetical protein KDE56_02980 [Anaerolineales bacterium]|nr:hypothetical protein [Anaerolineales bacterium]
MGDKRPFQPPLTNPAIAYVSHEIGESRQPNCCRKRKTAVCLASQNPYNDGSAF